MARVFKKREAGEREAKNRAEGLERCRVGEAGVGVTGAQEPRWWSASAFMC